MRILIAEDEVHLAEALSQILKKHHYSVDVVHDGEAGLDNAMSGIYDLLLLDVMMPKMDGFTVLKTLRAEGISTPVILLTAKEKSRTRCPGSITAPTITSPSRFRRRS